MTSAKGNDRLRAALIPFASSHPFLTAFAHTLGKKKKAGLSTAQPLSLSFNLEEKDMKKSLFGFVGYAYTIRVPCELSVNFSLALFEKNTRIF
ncbi:hypothetical protein [Aerococcus sp. UMB7834]|uniref:hypothetical protein n=1 Tax=Aerococcus sp. UMB7834 TaxID=3046342 RepID=UPI0025505D98|nr:hypothetical protein [Aerococcus sp. UMB7834]MDK6805939.1 hypothetical protein [Aerococcus sp. UMB7834]